MSQIGPSTRLEAWKDPRWRIRFKDLKDICPRVNIRDRHRKIQVRVLVLDLKPYKKNLSTKKNVVSKKSMKLKENRQTFYFNFKATCSQAN